MYPDVPKFVASKNSMILGKVDFDAWFESQIRQSVKIFGKRTGVVSLKKFWNGNFVAKNTCYFCIKEAPPLLEGWKIDIRVESRLVGAQSNFQCISGLLWNKSVMRFWMMIKFDRRVIVLRSLVRFRCPEWWYRTAGHSCENVNLQRLFRGFRSKP